jgi:glycosyltransferase involved in cell wall biosynthesis
MTAIAVDRTAVRERSGPLRVAVIITRFTAGAGGVALRGALCLPRDRFDPMIVTGSADPALTARAVAAGVPVLVEPTLVPQISPSADLAALHRLQGLLRSHRFDVVHTHSAKAGTLGRLAAAQTGVGRIVHTLHGFPFHEFQSPPRRAAYVAIERRLARDTDVFLAVGTAVAAEAVRRRIAPPDRLRTINPTIDGAIAATTPQRRACARGMLGLSAVAQVVGTVGRLDHQNAPRDFIEAVALLPGVHAVWIGDGPLRADIEALVRRRGLQERVTLVGARTDVLELLPALDVFAMSSLYEGLPCALAEAMATGIPVAATAVNAVPDLVVPGETGLLVPPAAPHALAAAIEHLLEHRGIATRLGRAGRAAVGAQFGAEALEPVLVDAYTASSPGRPPAALPAQRRNSARENRSTYQEDAR